MIKTIVQATRTEDEQNLEVEIFLMLDDPKDMVQQLKYLNERHIKLDSVDADTVRGSCTITQEEFMKMLDDGWSFTEDHV